MLLTLELVHSLVVYWNFLNLFTVYRHFCVFVLIPFLAVYIFIFVSVSGAVTTYSYLFPYSALCVSAYLFRFQRCACLFCFVLLPALYLSFAISIVLNLVAGASIFTKISVGHHPCLGVGGLGGLGGCLVVAKVQLSHSKYQIHQIVPASKVFRSLVGLKQIITINNVSSDIGTLRRFFSRGYRASSTSYGLASCVVNNKIIRHVFKRHTSYTNTTIRDFVLL